MHALKPDPRQQKALRHKTKSAGFSLIEILVSLVIGAIVIATVMGGFVTTSNTVKKVKSSQQLQKELNFAISRISDRMRGHSINYQEYEDGNFDIDSPVILFFGENKIKKQALPDGKFTLTMDGEPLFSEKYYLEVTDKPVFVITPQSDPYASDVSFRDYRQPRLTINLRAVSVAYPEVYYELQTTISSRLYR